MKVISNALKLIFRPVANAPIIDFPKGASVSEYGANNETPTIVVQNVTANEKPWQGVSYETGVVVVNGVPVEVAEMYLKRYAESGQTIKNLKQTLIELASNGYNDQYTTTLGYVATKLSPSGFMLESYTGIFKRNNHNPVECWREGDTYFVTPDDEPRVIEDYLLIRDYRLPDGSIIDLNQVPEGKPTNLK